MCAYTHTHTHTRKKPKTASNTVHQEVSVINPCDCMADWKLCLAAAKHHKRISHSITRLGKDQNSKFKAQFSLNEDNFYNLKNYKLNHHKSGTLYTPNTNVYAYMSKYPCRYPFIWIIDICIYLTQMYMNKYRQR